MKRSVILYKVGFMNWRYAIEKYSKSNMDLMIVSNSKRFFFKSAADQEAKLKAKTLKAKYVYYV